MFDLKAESNQSSGFLQPVRLNSPDRDLYL